MTDLEARIDRLESLDAIRQLVSKYALTLDMRDVDAHVNLFAEDIQVSRDTSGRPELKVWLDAMMRDQFTGTSHHIGNHVIEFDDPDHAHGVVYSKNEHETPSDSGDEWVIMQMMYWDNYEPPKDGVTPEVAAPAPREAFLKTMRGEHPFPKIRVK